MEIYHKKFALGHYADIHVAMLVANTFRVMKGQFEAVRLIQFDAGHTAYPTQLPGSGYGFSKSAHTAYPAQLPNSGPGFSKSAAFQ
jgi:hypothetical protein